MASDWSDWLQAIAAVLTALAVPELAKRAWSSWRGGLVFLTYSRGARVGGMEWKFGIEAKREITLPAKVFVYATNAGAKIIGHTVQTGFGQGTAFEASSDSNGDLLIEIERMPKGGMVIVDVKLSRPSKLTAMAAGVRYRMPRYDIERVASFFGVTHQWAMVEVAIGRLLLVVLQFGAITAIICAKMIYMGVFPDR